jgi:hypothetical protein
MDMPGFTAGLSVYSPNRISVSHVHECAPIGSTRITPQGGMGPGGSSPTCFGCKEYLRDSEWWRPWMPSGCSYNICCPVDANGTVVDKTRCQWNPCGCRYSTLSVGFGASFLLGNSVWAEPIMHLQPRWPF